MATKTRKVLVQEGADAFAAGMPSTDSQYVSVLEKHLWEHGWWKSFYAQRDQDRQRISTWLLDFAPVDLGLDESRADAIAAIVVMQGNYNRTQPIADNRIAGIEFTIPTPANLPDRR